mmetsp:Transcript_28623/g.46001  ORF Transcript_28623/g.46001 Transcript_28623/m.46001 type:complete len:114 (+) Transcript_28623:1149-1490(+)
MEPCVLMVVRSFFLASFTLISPPGKFSHRALASGFLSKDFHRPIFNCTCASTTKMLLMVLKGEDEVKAARKKKTAVLLDDGSRAKGIVFFNNDDCTRVVVVVAECERSYEIAV